MTQKNWNEKQAEKKEANTEDHPAFVTVQFSRISGLRTFFGSSVKSHHWIRLHVYKAKRYHNHGEDHIHGSVKEMVAIDLSPGQFAELLTTMNHGSGTPGTLVRFEGKEIPNYEEEHGETARSANYFKQEMESRAADFVEVRNEVQAILDNKKNLSQADRKQISDLMNKVVEQFRGDMPFYYEQFQEAAGRTVNQAKAEVDSFATHVIQRAGLEAIAQGHMPQLLTGEVKK